MIRSAQMRAARAMLQMTQAELAALVGTAPRTIALFELGERQPQGATLERIRNALEIAGVIFIETETGAGVLLADMAAVQREVIILKDD